MSTRRSRSRVRHVNSAYLEPTDTTSCRRPFWRRRVSVFRPPRVLMRARKPCLFFRFRLWGLYVGIMAGSPLVPGCSSLIIELAKISEIGPWSQARDPRASMAHKPFSHMGRIDFSTSPF